MRRRDSAANTVGAAIEGRACIATGTALSGTVQSMGGEQGVLRWSLVFLAHADLGLVRRRVSTGGSMGLGCWGLHSWLVD